MALAGFITSSLITTQQSGTTTQLENLVSGSSILGVNVSGYSQSASEDFPTTWTGSFNDGENWLSLDTNTTITNDVTATNGEICVDRVRMTIDEPEFEVELRGLNTNLKAQMIVTEEVKR